MLGLGCEPIAPSGPKGPLSSDFTRQPLLRGFLEHFPQGSPSEPYRLRSDEIPENTLGCSKDASTRLAVSMRVVFAGISTLPASRRPGYRLSLCRGPEKPQALRACTLDARVGFITNYCVVGSWSTCIIPMANLWNRRRYLSITLLQS